MLRRGVTTLGRVVANAELCAWTDRTAWASAGAARSAATRASATGAKKSSSSPSTAAASLKAAKDAFAGSPGKPKAAAAAAAKDASVQEKPKKRPLSAYSLFVKNEFPSMKKAMPDKPFAAIVKGLSDLWKELPADRRVKYQKEAQKLMPPKKADTGPKKPPTAWARFQKEMFKLVLDKHPGMAFADVSKKVGQAWRSLPALEKAARQDRYLKEVQAYEKQKAKTT